LGYLLSSNDAFVVDNHRQIDGWMDSQIGWQSSGQTDRQTRRRQDCAIVTAGSAVTSEVRFLDAREPCGEFKVLRQREKDVQMSVAHRGDHFFITLRDRQRPNSELLVAPVSGLTEPKVWTLACSLLALHPCNLPYAKSTGRMQWSVCPSLVV
jgi:hypothetical protein